MGSFSPGQFPHPREAGSQGWSDLRTCATPFRSMCYIQGLHVGTLFRVPTPKKKTFPGMVPVVRRFILWHRISQALVLQQISQSKILGREKPQTVENNSYSLSSQSTGSYNLGLLTLFPCSASAPSPTPTAAPPPTLSHPSSHPGVPGTPPPSLSHAWGPNSGGRVKELSKSAIRSINCLSLVFR